MNIKICWVGAATAVIDINNELRFACDPVLTGKDEVLKFKSFDSKRMVGPVYDNDTFKDIDLWFLTHGHLDHLDEEGKKVIDKNSTIICCKNTKLILDDEEFTNKRVLNWNKEHYMNVKGYEIHITAIPAFHGNNMLMRNVIGRVNGYFIEIEKNKVLKTFYITGDTVYTDKIVKSLAGMKIDYLLGNLGEAMSEKRGGPITMSCDMLDNLCDKLEVGKVIPMHINDFSHYETTEEAVLEGGYKILDRGTWLSI